MAGYKKKGNSEKWVLECWTYDWSGTIFRRVPVEFSFDKFKATKSIASLQSHVNFAIRYKDLDDKQKKTIYKNFIEQLTDENTSDRQQLLS